MSNAADAVESDEDLLTLRRISLLFLLTSIVFFPLILNPVMVGFFDQEQSDAATLEHVTENLDALHLMFTGIGVTELALGIALWLWGSQVAHRTSGRRGTMAQAFSWVGLVAGVLALAGRSTTWFMDADQLAAGDIDGAAIFLFLPASVGLSLSIIVFGWLMFVGAMPRWLGVVWILCGVLFWAGLLPLWFFVAGLVFGIWGLIKFRTGRQTIQHIAGTRHG